MTSFAFHGQPVANGLAFSVASMILHPCRFLKQRLPKHTKVTSAGNVCGRVTAKRGGKSKPASSLRLVVDNLHLPGVSEPFITWTMSGEAEFQEREGNNRPWITHRIKRGSFFLTTGGGIYDCRWKALTPEPFETMLVFVELPLIQRALEEVFGADAKHAHLRDLSAFSDADLNWLMERLHKELIRRKASPLL